MILITSAAYVNPSLASELGMLPPCMLPVQNKRLYMHQLSLFKDREEPIYLSLPESYELSAYDKKQLENGQVTLIKVPDGLSLGQSVIYCLNSAGHFDEPLYILHGDTLFGHLSFVPDSYVIARAEDNYAWASVDSGSVFAGFFAFSSQSHLIKCITQQNSSFIAGVELYGKTRSLERIMSDSWMDFGLVNTYYRSISNLTTQRVFNDLNIGRFSLKKSSHDINKMMAEAQWMQNLPKNLRHYAPAVWDSGINGDTGFYEMEYYYLSSLANLFVFCQHPQFVWNDILNACRLFIDDLAKYRPDSDEELSRIARNNDELYLPKTLKRLTEYAKETGISLDQPWKLNGTQTPSLLQIVQETGEMIARDKREFVTMMHGDFCFSNILYDFKSKSVKVIDPRGIDNDGNFSMFGDMRYDVAKLAHSIVGLYDLIIAGMFDYSESAPYDINLKLETTDSVLATQELFKTLLFGGYNIEELNVYPIMVHLFLSMLPLHRDNPERQKAMLANALRLYIELKSTK